LERRYAPSVKVTEDFDTLIRQLRVALGKQEVALGSINEAIVFIDPMGRIEWCNAAFDRLLGRPHLQLLGADLTGLFPLKKGGVAVPREKHPARVALKTALHFVEGYEFESGDQREVFNLEVCGTQAEFGEGNKMVVLVVRDITERKRTEEELARSNQELKKNVEELQLLNRVMMGREHRIVELKEKVRKLEKEHGRKKESGR